MTLLHALHRAARATPHKTFLRYNEANITYASAWERSRRAAHVLQELGVKSGDRIAAMCLNTPAFIDMMMGAWQLGAVFVPINHKLKGPEVDFILAHSGCAAVLFDASLAPVLSRVRHGAVRLSTNGEIDGALAFDPAGETADEIAIAMPSDDDVAQVLYTSGTTGNPKGCVLTHRAVTQAAIMAALSLSITHSERTLIAMPIWHASPLNNWFGATLYMSGTVVLLREYHPLHFLETIENERITLYFGAPVSYTLPLDTLDAFPSFDLSSVRAWIYGGGPIGAAQAERLARAYGGKGFYQVYGMTEAGPAGTVLYPEEQRGKPGSIGRHGTPGTDMRVVRADGGDAQPGDTGEIWLATRSRMSHYLNDPDATTAAFTDDGWFRTGDIARVDADGFLFIVDRCKDMIICGGENVYSKEVEDVLSAHPAVAEVAVIGVPHAEWGETVVAHVVTRQGASLDGESLSTFCRDQLAAYKIPRRYVFTDALPRTPTGKLQKFLLRQRPGA